MVDRPAVHLGALLAAAAARDPGAEAVVAGATRWTRADLARASAACAARLRAAGVGPGDRVALVLPNVPAFAAAAFACFRLGAVAMPLAPGAPDAELARTLAGGVARAVVAPPARAAALAGLPGGPAVLAVAPDLADLLRAGGEAPALPDVSPDPDAPALTQHSTGQSGRPKRVTRTHRQLLAEVGAVAAELRVGPADRIFGVAPLFHAYGFVNALLVAVARGATLVLPEDPALDPLPRPLLRALAAERVTGFPGVPFLFDALAGTASDPGPLALRYCTSAGSPLAPATAAAFRARFGVPVHSLYGATEVGVVAIDRGEGVPGTVGFPLPGVTVALRDPEGRPVPDGEEGDVAIASPAAAAGYDGPVGAEPGGSEFVVGVFLPGDLGRRAPDGRLVLTGRRRGFVNVGGTKVDPSEVEGVLRALGGVADAAVVGVPDPISGERLRAVVVAPGLDRDRILAHCRAALAPAKVPRELVFRDALPRSALGKLLRKDLLGEEAPER